MRWLCHLISCCVLASDQLFFSLLCDAGSGLPRLQFRHLSCSLWSFANGKQGWGQERRVCSIPFTAGIAPLLALRWECPDLPTLPQPPCGVLWQCVLFNGLRPTALGLSLSFWVLLTPDSLLGSPSPRDGICFLKLWFLNYLRVSFSFFLFSTTCLINPLLPWFSDLSLHQNRLEGFSKHRLLGPGPRVSGSLSLGLGMRICFSAKFPEVQICWSGDPTLRTTLTLYALTWLIQWPSLK